MLRLKLSVGRNPAPFVPGRPTTVYALIEIMPDDTGPVPNVPIDLRWIQDVSGSMSGTKLAACKAALARLVPALGSQDAFGLVAFNEGAWMVHKHGLVTSPASIHTAIAGLRADGSTSIAPGFALGTHWSATPGTQPTLMLMTDGRSEGGDVRQDETNLVSHAQHASVQGWRTVVIGIGTGYNHELLTRVAAQAPDSELFHIADPSEVDAVTDDVVAELRGRVLSNLQVSGIAAPGVTIKAVTACVPVLRSVLHKPTSFDFNAGSLSRHRGQRFLIQLEVANTTAGKHELLTITAAGQTSNAASPMERGSGKVSVTFTRNPDEMQQGTNTEVSNVAYLLEAAEAAKQNDFVLAATFYRLAHREDLALEMEACMRQATNGDPDEATRRAGSASRRPDSATRPRARGGVQ